MVDIALDVDYSGIFHIEIDADLVGGADEDVVRGEELFVTGGGGGGMLVFPDVQQGRIHLCDCPKVEWERVASVLP